MERESRWTFFFICSKVTLCSIKKLFNGIDNLWVLRGIPHLGLNWNIFTFIIGNYARLYKEQHTELMLNWNQKMEETSLILVWLVYSSKYLILEFHVIDFIAPDVAG